MTDFFKEFWLWILIPFVLVIGMLVVLYLMSGGDSISPFHYNI